MLLLLVLSIGCKKEPTETTTPLHKAAKEGNIEKVKSLIASGADVNAKSKYGDTPLHYAARRGHKIIGELLINKGAEVNAKNKSGETPLHIATFDGYKDFAEFLINNGANIDAMNKQGNTPLIWNDLRQVIIFSYLCFFSTFS